MLQVIDRNVPDAVTEPSEGCQSQSQSLRIQTLGPSHGSVAAGLNGEPFQLESDTIDERLWRVSDGWLQCDALGGWKDVFPVSSAVELARRIAWLTGA